MVAALAAAALALGIATPADAAAKPRVVPSLQPRATAKLWRKLVQPTITASSGVVTAGVRVTVN